LIPALYLGLSVTEGSKKAGETAVSINISVNPDLPPPPKTNVKMR
jgi:hypothetical protein